MSIFKSALQHNATVWTSYHPMNKILANMSFVHSHTMHTVWTEYLDASTWWRVCTRYRMQFCQLCCEQTPRMPLKCIQMVEPRVFDLTRPVLRVFTFLQNGCPTGLVVTHCDVAHTIAGNTLFHHHRHRCIVWLLAVLLPEMLGTQSESRVLPCRIVWTLENVSNERFAYDAIRT